MIWHWDLFENKITTDKSFFGYTEESIGTNVEWWLDKVHPADRSRLETVIERILQGRSENIQEEYRFMAADDTYKHIFSRGIIIRNAKNEPVKMAGVMMDLTDNHRLQKELSEQLLQHQKKLTEATILGQENERDEIGKELHDNINQILASVKLYLDVARDNEFVRDDLINRSRLNVLKAIDEI